MSDGLWVLRPWTDVRPGDIVFAESFPRRVERFLPRAAGWRTPRLTAPGQEELVLSFRPGCLVPVRADLQCEGVMTGKGDVLIVRTTATAPAAERAYLRKSCDELGIRYLLLPPGCESGILRAGDAPR